MITDRRPARKRLARRVTPQHFLFALALSPSGWDAIALSPFPVDAVFVKDPRLQLAERLPDVSLVYCQNRRIENT